jgi:hypothetical protein
MAQRAPLPLSFVKIIEASRRRCAAEIDGVVRVVDQPRRRKRIVPWGGTGAEVSGIRR